MKMVAFQRRLLASSCINIRRKQSTGGKQSLGVLRFSISKYSKRDKVFAGINSLGDNVVKNGNGGTSVADRALDSKSETGSGNNIPDSVEEMIPVPRNLR